jgi:hypothetical protein
MYKNWPLGPYRTLPAPLPGQRLIGDRYATKNGLLKRYRVNVRQLAKNGAFSASLMYHIRFEKKALKLFREMFSKTDADAIKAYQSYLRGYVGSWDYAYLFQLVDATIRIRKTLGGTPSTAEQDFLTIVAAVDKHFDRRPRTGDYFEEEFQLMQQQGGGLFDLIQADVHYAVLTKLLLTEMAWGQQDFVDSDERKRAMHRFISGYLVPRMIHGPFTGAEADYWRSFISEHIPSWWD